MAAAVRRPPPSRSAQGAAATQPALLCSLPFPPHCSACGVGDRGDNPNLEAERIPGFFQLTRTALQMPCASCLLNAQAPSLLCCGCHHHAPLWTMPSLQGHLRKQPCPRLHCLWRAPICRAWEPTYMGINTQVQVPTVTSNAILKTPVGLSVFVLMQMGGWCWLTDLGTICLCMCLHKHAHHLENPIALECFLAQNGSTWAQHTHTCPCQSSRAMTTTQFRF